MGGVININVFEGPTCIFLQGNTYLTNRGYDSKNHVGAGSVLKIVAVGPYVGPAFGSNNKYMNNVAEIRGGAMISFSAYYIEENSTFYSNF